MKDLRIEESKEIFEFAQRALKDFENVLSDEANVLYRETPIHHDCLLAIKWNDLSVVVIRLQGDGVHILNSDLKNYNIKDLRV